MSTSRRLDNDETWHRLRDWTKEQKASERLATAVLANEGFSVDPSHPLGGPDGGKDALCTREGQRFVAAVYFPRGQQPFGATLRKFAGDLIGVNTHSADGIVFVTNQELTLGERKALEDRLPGGKVYLYHLEKLAMLLSVPKNYGIRREFLTIDISESEFLSFQAARDEEHYQRLQAIEGSLKGLLQTLEAQTRDLIGYSTGLDSFVYFEAWHYVNSTHISLSLTHRGKYPVFDIQGYFVNLDEPPGAQGILPMHKFSFNHVYPETSIINAIGFDIGAYDGLRLNLFFNTRTMWIRELIRVARVGERYHIAYKVFPGGLEQIIRVTEGFPGYDPADPDSIFR